MVRLFIPEGESQHHVTTRRDGALVTTPNLIASPLVGTLAAVGWTGLLALGGRSRPGTFIKSAAIFSILDFSWEAAALYGRRELHRGVFKMYNIEPEPGKLWQRTHYWTIEDATLCGGALGITTVFNRRSVPGAYGFFRYFGATMVGCALGYAVGRDLLGDDSPRFIGEFNWLMNWTRSSYYDCLKEDPQAQASLSRIGKLALEYHTSPHIKILTPVLISMRSMSAASLNGIHSSRASSATQQEETNRERAALLHPPISVSFEGGELDGPDMQSDKRAYKDSIYSRDGRSIQERLEHIQNLRSRLRADSQLAWQILLKKEHEYYSHVENDDKKNSLRWEVCELNAICLELHTRCSILDYHQADSLKQLQQMKETGMEWRAVSPQELPEMDLQTRDSPHYITKRLRVACSEEAKDLASLERFASSLQGVSPKVNPHVHRISLAFKRQEKEKRDALEAKWRLLRWFEDQLRRIEQGEN